MLDAPPQKDEVSEMITALFDQIVQNVPQYIFWKDIHAIYLGCNYYYAQLMGLSSPQEIIGKTDKDLSGLVDKETTKFFAYYDSEMQAGKQSVNYEGWLLSPAGHKILIHIRKISLVNAQGMILGFIGIATDVTDQKRLEERIKKEQEDAFHNFEYIIAHMPGYIYWKNKESQYMGCNNNLAKLSHLSKPSDIVGKTDDDFEWGKEQAEQFRKDDQEIMRTGKTLTTEYELPIEREDGRNLYVRTDKLPFYDKGGKAIGILGVAIDITDQKILEKNFVEEKSKAEIANKTKTEFIRNMEHDIRTPFSGVWGLSTMLWQEETDPEKKEILGDITHCAKELLDYCNSVLDFSKIEAGTLPILAKKFDLLQVVKSAIYVEKAAAKHKGLVLNLKYDTHLPHVVVGDPYRLSRILLNLISNAVKFTDTGHIHVKVSEIKREENKKSILRFIIEDTGVGFPPDKKTYIYEKFTRLMPSNQGMYKGLGLGLRIVKQFVEEMEGEIDVKSKQGKGTIFYCTFPFKFPLIDDLVED